MTKKLVVLAGPDEGRTFSLGSDVVMLGRSRATETPLIDPHVAHIHCQVVPEGSHYVLVDHDSANGTYVNGKAIDRQKLQAGDLIRIGGTHLQFVDDPASTTEMPAQPAQTTPRKPIAWANALVGQNFSHYEISAALARGKTGCVFHARDTRDDTAVVMKVLHPDFGQDDIKVQHFVEAMKAVLPLSHPHLLKIFGAGKTGTYCWIAMEFSRSDSLAAVIGRIDKVEKIDWKIAARIATYLARALDYAHQKGLVHKNVTPQNILVGKQPQNIKLTDLMLANATEEDPTRPISAAGLPSDSLPYMSPERTDGPRATIDGRTDIYSLGATLYAMLAGKPPASGATVEEVIETIRLDEAPRLRSINAQVPEPLEKLVRRCLAKRPQDRFPTAGDLRKELEKIAQANNISL